MTMRTRRIAKREGVEWLHRLLTVIHRHHNRVAAFSPGLHAAQKAREDLLNEFILDRSSQIEQIASEDADSASIKSKPYEKLRGINMQIESETDDSSVWFDSLTARHGCTNQVIDSGVGEGSLQMTYPMMKRLLSREDIDAPSCRNCIIGRHEVDQRDGIQVVAGTYIPTECIFRPTAKVMLSGLGFKLTIKQMGRVRLDHEASEKRMRIMNIALSPDLQRKIMATEPDLIEGHQVTISDAVAGRYVIEYGWSQTISNNSSLVAAWQRSGLGRKEKMFTHDVGAAHQISTFEAVLDDISSIISTACSAWVPIRFSDINQVFTHVYDPDFNRQWPIYRMWCPADLLHIVKGDRLNRISKETPIFITDGDPIAPTEEGNNIMAIELDNIMLWR